MRRPSIVLSSFIAIIVLAPACASESTTKSASPAASSPGAATAPTTLDPGATTPATTATPTPAAPAPSAAAADAARGARLLRIDHVVDGDTIKLADGRTVRLLQIDTPEKYGSPECYGQRASATLRSLLDGGDRVWLERDPALDDVDRYGRLLRYVHVGSTNVNLWLVQRGAASVWFYGGDRGRYAARLLRAAERARAARRGLWGACRGTQLDTSRGVETGPAGSSGPADAASGAAQISGAGSAAKLPMAPPYPPDVDCADLPGPVRVTPDDPHRLDRNHDGIGCN